MKISMEVKKTVILFRLTGKFDSANARKVYGELDKAIRAGWKNIELHMAGVTSMGSAGLRVLMTIQSRIDTLNGTLVMSRLDNSTDRQLCGTFIGVAAYAERYSLLIRNARF